MKRTFSVCFAVFIIVPLMEDKIKIKNYSRLINLSKMDMFCLAEC